MYNILLLYSKIRDFRDILDLNVQTESGCSLLKNPNARRKKNRIGNPGLRLMKESVDVPPEFRKSLSKIDYTSPVCKINVAVNK